MGLSGHQLHGVDHSGDTVQRQAHHAQPLVHQIDVGHGEDLQTGVKHGYDLHRDQQTLHVLLRPTGEGNHAHADRQQ